MHRIYTTKDTHELLMIAASVAAGFAAITATEHCTCMIDPGTAAEADRCLTRALGKQLISRANGTQAQIIALASREMQKQ